MKLRGYQQRAYEASLAALRGGGGFLLSMEMRTGKTLVALEVARYFKVPTIVVCPKIAIPVWNKHIGKMKIRNIRVVNYERVVIDKVHWYKWGKENRNKWLMILDESHYIKNRGADRSRVVRALAKYSKYRLALTGTPIANGIQDAWAQYDYLGQIFGPWENTWEGGLDGRLIPGFEATYLVRGGFKMHEIVGYRNQKKFNKIFHKHQFRVTLREAKEEGRKGHMVLRYQKRYFGLPPVPLGIYSTLQEELVTYVNGEKIEVPNVLSLVAKLQQICGGHVIQKIYTGRFNRRGDPIEGKQVHLIEEGWNNGIYDGKIRLLLETVGDLPKGKKFIVICRFIHELEIVSRILQRIGYTVAMVRGGMPYDGVFGTDAIVMQIQSGQAVDMSKADTVMFYSMDYSYINFEQSRFRILGYEKSFGKYVFLLAKDTIDEIIYEAIRTKKKVADLVIDTFRKRKKRYGKRKSQQTDRVAKGKVKGKAWRGSCLINFSEWQDERSDNWYDY
jgi:rhodanese-related sulfurtransferase